MPNYQKIEESDMTAYQKSTVKQALRELITYELSDCWDQEPEIREAKINEGSVWVHVDKVNVAQAQHLDMEELDVNYVQPCGLGEAVVNFEHMGIEYRILIEQVREN